MTPAEFKSMRESMGMSAAEVAQAMSITQKSVFGFEASNRSIPVPEERARQIVALRARFDDAVKRAGRKSTLLRYTDERDFQDAYGVDLPLSTQGPLLFAASGAKDAAIEYA